MNTTKLFSTLALILCLSFTLSAQTNEGEQTQENKTETTQKKQTVARIKPYIKDATIKEQFDYIMEKGDTWKNYKVIQINWMKNFQNGFVDSLNAIRQDFINSEKLVAERDKRINSLELDLKESKESLTTIQGEKDSMSLLGIQMSKASYNVFIWSLVGGLLVLAGFSFYYSKEVTPLLRKLRFV